MISNIICNIEKFYFLLNIINYVSYMNDIIVTFITLLSRYVTIKNFRSLIVTLIIVWKDDNFYQ